MTLQMQSAVRVCSYIRILVLTHCAEISVCMYSYICIEMTIFLSHISMYTLMYIYTYTFRYNVGPWLSICIYTSRYVDIAVDITADRVAHNLEIMSKNFQFSTMRTRILLGFIIYYLVLIVHPMGRILVH